MQQRNCMRDILFSVDIFAYLLYAYGKLSKYTRLNVVVKKKRIKVNVIWIRSLQIKSTICIEFIKLICSYINHLVKMFRTIITNGKINWDKRKLYICINS